MSDLDEAGRALIALADDAHDPTDMDRARVRAALARRLGAAAGLGLGAVAGVGATAKAAAGAGTVASAGGATTAVAGSALAMKLMGIVAITTAVGVGAGIKIGRRSVEPGAAAKISEVHTRRIAAPLPAPAPPPLPAPALAPAREQSTIEEVPPARPIVQPAPRHETRRNEASPIKAPPDEAPPAATTPPPAVETPAATTAASDPCAPAQTSQSGVAGEARLVTDGVRARRSGRSACALSLLDAHARVFPDGVLAEERDAERALALAALGRTAEARTAATAFLRKYPASPLGARLRHLADASR
jgi:hypothetical protein